MVHDGRGSSLRVPSEAQVGTRASFSVILKAIFRALLAMPAAAALAACSIVPGGGPQQSAVEQGAAMVALTPSEGAAKLDYALVHVNGDMAKSLGRVVEARFGGSFGPRGGAQPLRIGAGDVLSITIFEAGPGGLFTAPATTGVRPGNFVELPPQTVGPDGRIQVPYAGGKKQDGSGSDAGTRNSGTISAIGRTPEQLAREIERVLAPLALEPQVVVTFREQRSAQVSVLGEVSAPAKLTINPLGERVLDMLARAGGPRYPAYETVVTLQRGGRREATSLTSLVKAPANNVFVQPGDTLYVQREQRYFVALGATGQNGLYFFDSENVNLSYAMGKAAGLLDERAEPSAVYLYRLESRQRLMRLGVDVAQFPGEMVPTIYTVNLRDPSALFLTQSMQMQDRDVVFVSNAAIVDATKFLQFIRIGLATVNEGAAIRHPFVANSN